MEAIRKATVIGAGVMGAGIAAQFANAGVPVLLLDVVPSGATNRNALAEGAIAKMLKTDPAPFMSARAAKLVTPAISKIISRKSPTAIGSSRPWSNGSMSSRRSIANSTPCANPAPRSRPTPRRFRWRS
jgi:choline dehydrogenase-like flavoprotein